MWNLCTKWSTECFICQSLQNSVFAISWHCYHNSWNIISGWLTAEAVSQHAENNFCYLHSCVSCSKSDKWDIWEDEKIFYGWRYLYKGPADRGNCHLLLTIIMSSAEARPSITLSSFPARAQHYRRVIDYQQLSLSFLYHENFLRPLQSFPMLSSSLMPFNMELRYRLSFAITWMQTFSPAYKNSDDNQKFWSMNI